MNPKESNLNVTDELARLKSEFAALAFRDDATRKRLLIELETVTNYALGDEADRFIEAVGQVSFYPFIVSSHGREMPEIWARGKTEMVALIESIEHALSMANRFGGTAEEDAHEQAVTNKVFVVHGHDKGMLNAVEVYVRRLGLEAIVLGEEAHRGRTLIEKFEHFSEVSYAVVLLSPDDIGRSRTKPAESDRPRPRQNAVLELGYFMGLLGRERVAAVVDATVENAEYPSDINGVAYIPFNAKHTEWQLLLLREFRAAKLPVDEARI